MRSRALGALSKELSNFFHDAFVAAPAGESGIALRVSELMEQIDVGLSSMLIIEFFGFTFASYGAALIQSDSFHMAYGWIALVPGIVAIGIGVYQAIDHDLRVRRSRKRLESLGNRDRCEHVATIRQSSVIALPSWTRGW